MLLLLLVVDVGSAPRDVCGGRVRGLQRGRAERVVAGLHHPAGVEFDVGRRRRRPSALADPAGYRSVAARVRRHAEDRPRRRRRRVARSRRLPRHQVRAPVRVLYSNNDSNHTTIAAEAAATRKAAEYAGLERSYIFQPVVVENLGTMNASAYGFLAGLGQKISAISGNDRETCYLFKRISVLIQRFNATLLHESFADENRSDD